MFCEPFRLIFGKCQILDFGDFFLMSGKFFDHFRTPGAPAASGVWPNVDFKAYQKIDVFVNFFTLPDNFGARFSLASKKDLEPRLCMRFSF